MEHMKELSIEPKTKVLFIYPHPDDETFGSAGLIQRLVKNNNKPHVMCLTKGGASTLALTLKPGESLTSARENEFIKVMKLLGVDQYTIADLTDGQLAEQRGLVANTIMAVIEKVKPEIIVTYEPNGLYGHPDHILASAVVTELARNNGLRLIYSTTAKDYNPPEASLRTAKYPHEIHPIEPNAVFKLTLREYLKKMRCFSQYKTQFSPTRNFTNNVWRALQMMREYYFVDDKLF
jgi:LmbE family N-acetylglucosaminyl deacetylase